MNYKKIVQILSISFAILLTVINEYKTKIDFIENHELSIILGAIIIILWNQYNTDSSLEEAEENILNDISDIDQKTMEIARNGKGGLITEIEATKVFNNYIGKNYFAYNAPLQYELENLNERIEYHINRYKNSNFEMAHYYYPIFATKDTKLRNIWMRGVYDFYDELNKCKRLSSQEKQKITFYVPKEDCSFSVNSDITYFIGKKSRGHEAVVYIHNSAFMDLYGRRPTAMIVINDEKKIEDLRRHRTDTTRGKMDTLVGIDNFLGYLKKRL